MSPENEKQASRGVDPLLYEIHGDLQGIKQIQSEQKATLDEMKDILIVWNNTKGFIRTMFILGTVIKWIVSIGAAAGLIWYWMKK